MKLTPTIRTAAILGLVALGALGQVAAMTAQAVGH